jgi:hypothetical protein
VQLAGLHEEGGLLAGLDPAPRLRIDIDPHILAVRILLVVVGHLACWREKTAHHNTPSQWGDETGLGIRLVCTGRAPCSGMAIYCSLNASTSASGVSPECADSERAHM